MTLFYNNLISSGAKTITSVHCLSNTFYNNLISSGAKTWHIKTTHRSSFTIT